jgi:ATP-dependent Clp protease ATP-binding subunit ClpB
MRLDRLTTKAREAVMAASQIAAEMGNPELYPEHLVLALLVQEGGLARPIVEKSGPTPRPCSRA